MKEAGVAEKPQSLPSFRNANSGGTPIPFSPSQKPQSFLSEKDRRNKRRKNQKVRIEKLLPKHILDFLDRQIRAPTPKEYPPSPKPQPPKNLTCKIRPCYYNTAMSEDGTVDSNQMFYLPTRYRPLEMIGCGSYGFVISALDRERKKKVAIKVMKNIFTMDEEVQKRVFREILILISLRDHTHVTRLHDLIPPLNYPSFDDVCFVTSLVDTDLKKFMLLGDIEDEYVKKIIFDLLCGLKEIHSKNILHRDIKPSNILLDDDMNIKICDFGLAKCFLKTDITMSTVDVVTMYYRAPELLMMETNVTKSIDIWSVGCILAELLSDKPLHIDRVLFVGNSWADQLTKILRIKGLPQESELRGSQPSKRYVLGLKPEEYPGKNFNEIFPKANPLALDLLEKMLRFDGEKRVKAEEAMKHEYFRELYEEYQLKLQTKREEGEEGEELKSKMNNNNNMKKEEEEEEKVERKKIDVPNFDFLDRRLGSELKEKKKNKDDDVIKKMLFCIFRKWNHEKNNISKYTYLDKMTKL